MKKIVSLLVAVSWTAATLWGQNKPPGKNWQMIGEGDSLVIVPLTINSARDDYSPILIDGMLYFTSDRKNRNTDEAELQYNENIYVSSYQDSTWSSPKKWYFFNSDDYTALAGYSIKDTVLFTYKTFGGGDFYSSKHGEKNWSTPTRMKAPFNSEGHEQSITEANGVRVIASERPGGKGEHDIYWAVNDLGQYIDFRALDVINTTGDEVDVSLSSNGRILYFSSNGLDGAEGYDIYFSTLDKQGQWTKPEKMPINSASDDRWFMDADSMFFLSSNRSGGTGGDDLYWGYVIPLPTTYDTSKLADILPDTTNTIPSSHQSFMNERPEVGIMTNPEADGKLTKLHSILEVLDFVIYKGYVQIGAYYYLTSIDEFKRNYPAFDTTNIFIEKAQTNRGTLYKYIIDKEYATLQECALRQQEAIRQQKDPINGFNVQKDAFIAIYNKDGERILIYFNVEKKIYKILMGNQLIDF